MALSLPTISKASLRNQNSLQKLDLLMDWISNGLLMKPTFIVNIIDMNDCIYFNMHWNIATIDDNVNYHNWTIHISRFSSKIYPWLNAKDM